MKKIIITVLSLVAMVSLVGCESGDSDTLRIGMECAYAPFNWAQSTANDYTLPISGDTTYADGYDVQMAKYLSEQLDREVEIVKLEWDSLTTQLQLGMIDLIIAGMSPTDERKEIIDFTDGYYTTTHVIVMRTDSEYIDATGLDDFAGAEAVGQVETLYDSLIDQLTGVIHQTPLSDTGLMTTAIKSGTADIMILERPVAQSIVNTNSELTFITLEEPFELAESDAMVSIGVAKGNDDLLAELNTALALLSEADRTAMMDAAVERQLAL